MFIVYKTSTTLSCDRDRLIDHRGEAVRRKLPAFIALLALGTAAFVPAAYAAGPLPVKLGLAGRATILSETGVTDVATSTVQGNVGTSPITGAADLLSCSEVTGFIYSVDAAGPAPCSIDDPVHLTRAVGDMQAAYTDAAGRVPDYVNVGSGNIGGYVLTPGVYQWTSGVTIPSNVTISGTKHDVWIFQVAGNVDISANVSVLLQGGAQTKNIFWQVAGTTTLETSSVFEGIILAKTLIAMQTNAYICGKLLAQTAVTLQQNYVMDAN
jgi:hypothetical protein